MFIMIQTKPKIGIFCSRCLAGLLNGNVGVMKSMMAELTDSTNIAQGLPIIHNSSAELTLTTYKIKGFSLIPITWSIGATIGYGRSFNFSDLMLNERRAQPRDRWYSDSSL